MAKASLFYKCTACSIYLHDEASFFEHSKYMHCRILISEGNNPDCSDYCELESENAVEKLFDTQWIELGDTENCDEITKSEDCVEDSFSEVKTEPSEYPQYSEQEDDISTVHPGTGNDDVFSYYNSSEVRLARKVDEDSVNLTNSGRQNVLPRSVPLHRMQGGMYKCQICAFKYSSREGLRRHLRVHTGEKPYHCSVCQKRFYRIDVLKTHMAIHTNVKSHLCQICNKRFRARSTLKKHLHTHGLDNLVANSSALHDFSGRDFSGEGSTESGEDILKKNLVKSILKKNVKILPKLPSVSILRSSGQLRPHKCDQCEAAYYTLFALKRHKIVHASHSVDVSRAYYSCTICGRHFRSKGSYMQHSRTHTTSKQIGLQPECPQSQYADDFTLLSDTGNEALNNEVADGENFVKDVPNSSFQSGIVTVENELMHTEQSVSQAQAVQFLDSHIEDDIAVDVNESVKEEAETASCAENFKTSYCCKCNEVFATDEDLNVHQESCQRAIFNDTVENVKLVKNIQCYNPQLNTDLMENCHSYKKANSTHRASSSTSRAKKKKASFFCDFCFAAYTTRSNLARHRLTHTGEKPHKCEYCEKAFTRTDLLAGHLKTCPHRTKT